MASAASAAEIRRPFRFCPGGVSSAARVSTLAREAIPPRCPARSATCSSRPATAGSTPTVAFAACQASRSTSCKYPGRGCQGRVDAPSGGPVGRVVHGRPNKGVPEPHAGIHGHQSRALGTLRCCVGNVEVTSGPGDQGQIPRRVRGSGQQPQLHTAAGPVHQTDVMLLQVVTDRDGLLGQTRLGQLLDGHIISEVDQREGVASGRSRNLCGNEWVDALSQRGRQQLNGPFEFQPSQAHRWDPRDPDVELRFLPHRERNRDCLGLQPSSDECKGVHRLRIEQVGIVDNKDHGR